MKKVSKRSLINKVTIDDVAEHAGVSKTTVSRYLSGQYNKLSEKTCKSIEKSIKDLDYRPNQMARALKGNHSNLIGIIIADITNPFSTAILRGAEDVCRKNNYSVMVCNTDNDPAKERDYIFMLQSHRIDGLIITTTGQNNEFLYQLSCDKTPVVLVDRKIPELEFDTVVVDNRQGVVDAMTFLMEQGYEDIAFFIEPIDGISSRFERLSAFRDMLNAWKDNNLHGSFFEFDIRDNEQLKKNLDNYLSISKGKPRAAFAANGVVMLKLILALQQRGLKIPEDISVIGFDNLDWTEAVGSGITTVAQPTYELGVIAMERLIKRISGDRSLPQKIELPVKLIVRGSTPLKKK